ncbi:MAG: dCMP deaminase family protein [Candidatus Diapherotrites archaeon]|nr:dCMP deaminase family protein [Candidatus Diapherotrites archaeon]
MKKERPSLDEYFMNVAKVVATRSTCLRHDVGAVIVKDKHIIATGYNGAPANLPHCLDIGCIRNERDIPSGTQTEICRAVHAEQNAIIQAALHGNSPKGATLYCTHAPCILCAKMIINAKMKRVVFAEEYPNDEAVKMMEQAGIELVHLNK